MYLGAAEQRDVFRSLAGLVHGRCESRHYTRKLPDGVGTAYSVTLKADECSGGCVWSSMGALPPGLSMGSTSGTISGTPTSVGSFRFSITATGQKSNSSSQSYKVDIADAALTIKASPLPDGNVGTPYSQALGVHQGDLPRERIQALRRGRSKTRGTSATETCGSAWFPAHTSREPVVRPTE